MKNTKKCPKCPDTDIVIIPGQVRGYGAGNNILTGAFIFSAVKVTRYLCGSCGFTEEWIDDEADIKKIKDKYSK